MPIKFNVQLCKRDTLTGLILFIWCFIQMDLSAKAQDTVHFSNHVWNIRSAEKHTHGPGNNYWSADKTKNVWVDEKGLLHLKLTRDANHPSKWYCAQVETRDVMGKGTYQFEVEGAIDKLNENVVFGMFSYPDGGKKSLDGFDEIDIEYSRWGNKTNSNNFDYVVYGDESRDTSKANIFHHVTLNGIYTTQRYTRRPKKIIFESLGGFYNGNTNLYHQDVLHQNKKLMPAKRDMPVVINLWLYKPPGYKNKSRPPSDGKEVEIIIHSFKFTAG